MTINPQDLQLHEPDKTLCNKINKIKIKEKILFKKESIFHDIYVVENNFGRFIKFSDTYQAGCINSKHYRGNLPYINYFLIPYLMNKNIKDILLIGLGSGIIIKQYFQLFDKINRVDIVDIDENIYPLAVEYFNFQLNSKTNFYLQDAIIYLKTTKKKYDLIVVDIANNSGVDNRIFEVEYLNLIKSKLKKKGIFVSNLPSSRDIFNKKNKLILKTIDDYKKMFDFIDIYNGETSNKIYYEVFFNIKEPVYDITNLILISSNFRHKISSNYEKLNKINVDIKPYIFDLIK